MPDLLARHAEYKQADLEALLMRARARARLGREVVREFEKGTPLTKMARKLGVVDEQVRRYRQAYRDWLRDHPDEPLDDEAAAVDAEAPN